MSDVAIRVDGLGKRFRLRHQSGAPRYRTLREDLLAAPRELWARWRHRRTEQEEFWALKDVSFEVKQGEVLGIIGRNGAGKSTLLKILSRIMDPTTGEATVYGRIGSLLEVGTGFHPELTGRENIYLSGALLGMKRAEVRRRFDEIVEFAGVEKFLDTPCKHYSSGMYTRLGFAVAAHLDTEILLVDEVLAVGDAEFQKRCLGKMTEIAEGGRTVLFVSHNMGAVGNLCCRTLLMGEGVIMQSGKPQEVIDQYLIGLKDRKRVTVGERRDRGGDGANRLTAVRMLGAGPSSMLKAGASLTFEFEAERPMDRVIFAIYGKQGELIADFDSSRIARAAECPFPSSCIACAVGQVLLLPGAYTINIAIFREGRMTDHLENAVNLDVVESEIGGTVAAAAARGLVFFPHLWMRR